MPTAHKNKTKRHCMVVFAPYPLGETRVQREAEALVKNGYEVDVICLRVPGSDPVDDYKGVKIYREKYRFLQQWIKKGGLGEKFFKYMHFFFTAAFRVTKLHLQKRYDTIQVHNLPDFLVFCTLIPKWMGVPIILDLHDLMPEFYSGRYGNENSWQGRLIRMQERLSCRFANHVITVSEHWRQALIRRGVPDHKCSVVMNVADDTIFSPCESSPNLPVNGSFRLIYHGAMVERYGLGLAVQAVDQLRHEIPGIHLSLIGRGEYLPKLIEMVKERGLDKNVSIEDLHLAEELPDIIRSCHLGVVAYKNDVFTDGLLPTKLMEYAALGLPAVASRTTAIQAYFTDSNAAFFEPGDVDDLARCIRDLYHNPDCMAELAEGSKKFTQRYNWPKVSAEYVALVQRLGED